MKLRGQVALITGAGSGIGEATAYVFGREGAKVAVMDINRAEGERVTAALCSREVQASFHELDVSQPADVERAVDGVEKIWGRIDILFNNAGVSCVGTVADTSPDEWDRVMGVNVRGVYLMNRKVVPIMVTQGRGVIINMSSAAAVMGLQERVAYASSKGAILAMTKAMAADHSHQGIRVSALLPGTVYTPFVEGYLERHYAGRVEAAKENLKSRQLNHQLMTPDDVARAALFLASDDARFALGAALIMDGGLSEAKVF